MLIAASAVGVTYASSLRAEQPTAVSVVIPPPRAAALVEATTGDAAGEFRALGLAAQKINAALPFNAGPVQVAKPFSAPAGGTAYDRALTCLTQAVYYEAGFEPVEGRRAVAQVVLNRMRHPAFPKSVCGVVYQRNATPVCQFSFVCDGSLNRAPAAASWAVSRRIAAEALAGYVEPSVGSATHYHANYVAPRWAPLLAKITQIGAHIFYRWPGAWGQPAAFTGRYIGEPSDPSALRPILRAPVLTQRDANGEIIGVNAGAVSGPPIARAANDVGGLLDTSKGWTLNIPLPSDVGSKAQAIASTQQVQPPQVAPALAAAAAASGGATLASN
jgi:spore germination cell wall hydrolase CwlJ-like protein